MTPETTNALQRFMESTRHWMRDIINYRYVPGLIQPGDD